MNDYAWIGLFLSLAGMLASFGVHVVNRPRQQIFVVFVSLVLGLAGLVLILFNRG